MTSSDTKEVNLSNSGHICKTMVTLFDNLLKDSKTLSQKCLFQREKILRKRKKIYKT